MTHPDTVVVLRALGLGDVLTAVPALRLLRSALPEMRICLLAPAEAGELALRSGAVDEVISADLKHVVDADRVAGLAPSRPAVAVNMHGRGPQSHLALAALEPARLIGYDFERWQGPFWRSDEHEVLRWCRLVRWSFPDVSLDPIPTPRIPGTPIGRPGLTVVHPGAASGARRWPLDRFIAVSEALAAQGHIVVISHGPGERELATTLARASNAEVLPAMSATELHGVLLHARMLVSNDTGVAHLAYAAGTPSVVLFGPVSPRIWGPFRDSARHRVLFHGDGTGDPHADVPDAALLRITVDEVLEACRSLAVSGVGQLSRCQP